MAATDTAPTLDELIGLGLEREVARRAVEVLSHETGPAAWMRLVREVLSPAVAFDVHRRLYAACRQGETPLSAWSPTEAERGVTNVVTLGGHTDAAAFHRWSVEDPGSFWSFMIDRLGVVAHRPATSVLDVARGVENAAWFPGMRLNIASSVFAGRDPDVLAIVQQAEDGVVTRISLGELHDRALAVARALKALGYGPGDALAIHMPMTVDAVVIYLGVVLLGGAVVSISDTCAAGEIATRVRVGGAVGLFTQDRVVRGGHEHLLYQRVVEAGAPRAVVLPASGALCGQLRKGDLTWDQLLSCDDHTPFSARIVDREGVTDVLFSPSGGGDPLAVPWTHLTPLKAAADAWAHHDVRPGDVLAWPTDMGSMMAPWLLYAALLNGAAMALYDGAPTGRGFCRFVADQGITLLGVNPSLVASWRSSGATDGLDWSGVRCFSSTGARSDPDDMLWLMSRAGYKPVIEYRASAALGGACIAGSMLQPQAPALYSTPAIGCEVTILDGTGAPADEGELALLPPMLGSSSRLLNGDHHAVFFDGMPSGPRGRVLRRHGDRMEHLPSGWYRALDLVDDAV